MLTDHPQWKPETSTCSLSSCHMCEPFHQHSNVEPKELECTTTCRRQVTQKKRKVPGVTRCVPAVADTYISGAHLPFILSPGATRCVPAVADTYISGESVHQDFSGSSTVSSHLHSSQHHDYGFRVYLLWATRVDGC